MRVAWRLRRPGEKPRPAGVPLSRFCPRLPDHEAYVHQVETVKAFRKGRNVLLIAGTGAGKTEAALAAAWEERPILFVYPTKPLTRDQEGRFRKYGIEAVIADGDHRGWRKTIDRAEIVLTNPQMLWYHARNDGEFWDYVASEVGAIVWDEVHHYDPRRANKLLGLAKALRHVPQIFMSATVGKPGRFAREIRDVTRRPVKVVKGRGSMGPRTYLAYDGYSEVDLLRLLEGFAEDEDVKTIVYARSRAEAERIGRALRDEGLPAAYHHGALDKEEREEVEEGFRRGDLRLIVTVKTLEVGIDVGEVGRIVHVGLPPSVSDFLQREGRAGRKGEPAESHLIPADPWSSFVLESPRRFERDYLEGRVEAVPARASSPFAVEPWRLREEFYGDARYRIVDARSGTVLRGDVSSWDVVHYYAPGKTFEKDGRVWIVVGRPRGGGIPVVPVEDYDRRVARLVGRGWWTMAVTRAVALGRENVGVGRVRVEWEKTLLVPPPGEGGRAEVLVSGPGLREDVETFYVRYEGDVLKGVVGRDSAEYAVHALTRALRVVEGYPSANLRHYVCEDYVLIYENPAAVMPYLDWAGAIEEAMRIDSDPRALRLPTCTWPSGKPSVSRPVVRRILRRLGGLFAELREVPEGRFRGVPG